MKFNLTWPLTTKLNIYITTFDILQLLFIKVWLVNTKNNLVVWLVASLSVKL